MKVALEGCRQAYIAVADGSAVSPERRVAHVPEHNGDMLAMSGYLPDGPALGAKIVSVFPGNRERNLESTMGIMVLLDPETGRPEVLMDGTFLTSIRTGAGSGMATDILAREDADSVAIVGTGGMAWHQLEAVRAVRPIKRVFVWNRTRAGGEDFAARLAGDGTGITVEVMASAEQAIREAAIVCAATSSPEPVVRGAWLQSGTHVNLIGAHRPDCREADTQAVCAASVRAVDSVEAGLTSGDLAIPVNEGSISAESLVPIGAVAAGMRKGRKSAADITLFKSVGLAAQDLAIAKLVRDRAMAAGLGAKIGL